MPEPACLLEIDDLRVEFAGRVRAVDGVSLRVGTGETLGLVGESGSGKSTVGNAVLGLVRPTGGRISLSGVDITHLTGAARRKVADRVQVVFQDPNGSLNPSRTVGSTLAEPLRVRRRLDRVAAGARVADALLRVGLAADAARRYPRQFSGGQRQRIAIARALVLEPDLVICDEPTSALDLSVQAQVLNLLLDLQRQLGMAYLFISHDIDVVEHMSHRVAVLKGGHVVEQGDAERVLREASHPYTRALLTATRHASTTEAG
ncbi:MAG TPA: ABC transporter ATP-binding protein [Actinophytocola sp.]|jgi:ABC-type glutathione transport system ATPase component|uniref:ABC transporter ATP-binding protein n=1 Tax=Actinophytocola sp. TaxID=1872138 RepID=UPI002F928AEF